MQLGVIGLSTMGSNLARNAARNGAKVAVFNRTTEKMDEFMKNHGTEGEFVGCKTIEELCRALSSPRAILIMVKAGQPVDDVIAELVPHLSDGDILIDGGNSHYADTARRCKELAGEISTLNHQLVSQDIVLDEGMVQASHQSAKRKLHFIGMGVSGGEEGALHGPSMMPGGSQEAFEHLKPLLSAMAADDGTGGKCVSYMGVGGTGHFVKMVHNGIEYGMMQMIAESYDLLKRLGGLSNTELGQIFTDWSTSPELRGFLMEITAKIFAKKDIDTGSDLLDMVKDAAAQKGTGKWTTEAAFHYGVSVPSITAAVDARIMSSAKAFRDMQAKATPLVVDAITVDRKELISDVRMALELSMLNAYAQGLQLISEASKQEGWNVNISEVCRIWRGGCIIRSSMVETYQKAFAGDRDAGLSLRGRFQEGQTVWRHVVALGALRGIALPSISSALWYYDSYRTARLPQNLIQAQRDFFGAHGFERLDKEGSFHVDWNS